MKILIYSGSLLMTAALAFAEVPPTSQQQYLGQYCTGCHNERAKVAGLALDGANIDNVSENPQVWEKVVRKVRAGMMPPAGARRADKATSEAFLRGLEASLDRAEFAHPDPGSPILHRLNRTEYTNAVRDLLSVEIDASTILPADDSSAGFDNNADSLGVSPALMERYLAAASKISRMAVGDASIAPAEKIYPVAADLTQDHHVEGLPFGTRGGLLVRHLFPLDGEYVISVELSRGGTGAFAGNASTKGEELEISLNGERKKLFDLSATPEVKLDTKKEDAPSLQIRLSVRAGQQLVGVAFTAKNYAPAEDTLRPYQRSMLPGDTWTVLPHVGSVSIKGPFKIEGVGDTASRRRIFLCRPASTGLEINCAKKIIGTIARRAFRRPISEGDVDSLMSFYQAGRNKGNFEAGIEMAVRRILVSPEFMFRFERDSPGAHSINDVELASRLSFFLWSTIPDDTLLALAEKGQLKNPAVLNYQVRRMLGDARSAEFVKNFAGQWLYLRNLQSLVPAIEEFPDFDDNLRQAFRQETEMLFASIVSEDRSVVDLLTADYTFANERLAKHYGLPNIYGSHFRRVKLPADSPRRGLLGQGSMLTATSLATRTSPVLRGKWILENILGTPPPEPPPNVPALKENVKVTNQSQEGVKVLSVRERLEEHRANPVCAGCHKMMDPIGFALENFDAVGHWRSRDGNAVVDASGQLVDGAQVDGPVKLREALLVYREQYLRTVTEKLLTYAIGRGVTHHDQPVIRSIVRASAKENYRFSSLVSGIVTSAPFQRKMQAPLSQTATARP